MRAPGIRQYLALLVLAALLPVAGLALALFFLSLKSEYEVAWQRAGARTTFIAAAVQTQMDALAGTLDVLSASPTLNGGDLNGFHAHAQVITGERVDAVSLVRPDGTTILNSRVPPGEKPPAFSVPTEEVQRALAENGTIVSAVFTGATSRRPIFAMIKPVMVAGQPHALAVGLFASRFAPLIDRAQAPWTAALLDATGATVAQFPEPTPLSPAVRTNILAALAHSKSERLSAALDDGDDHLLVAERIPLSHWVAVSSLPREAVGENARRTAFIYAAGATLLSIPSALLAMWLGWRLARSMQSLARFATALGEPSTVPPAPSQRSACKELDVMAETLERAACEVAARDAQLRQERDVAEQRAEHIRHQTEELSRSNIELEQFAYAASHDLREPLRMISSFLTLLERKLGPRLDEEGRDFMAYARDGAVRMDTMILDLLQYSRVGRMETEVERVDLRKVLNESLSELAARIDENSAKITVEGTLPTVPGHPGELSRLFTNLIGNALKYRDPDRTPHIRIAATAGAEDWKIAVTDNGIGIDPQFHQRIFAIFQRLHTRERYEGNGIGLAICKKVVEHHRGRLWVESTPGAGATFHFTLALRIPEEKQRRAS